MRTHPLLRLLSVALVLGLTLPGALAGQSSPRATKKAALPFLCFTEAWRGSFEVISARYERRANRVVWVLQAKKDMRLPACDAFLGDGDGVEQATVKVKWNPARDKVKAGTRLHATVTLGAVSAGDVARL